MAVATILHQGGKLVQLNGSFPLVFVSHQVRHPRHVVPYILTHGDLYRLAPPVTGAVNVYGAYSGAEAGQPAEDQETLDEVPRRWPHCGGRSSAGSPTPAAGARLPPSLPPAGTGRWGVRAGSGGRRESLQRPHGSCRGQHRPRAWPGSSAAGDGGSQVSIARAAPLSTGPAAARGGGGQLHNDQQKNEHPQSTDAQNLLRGARQLSFPWASTFAIPGLPLLRSVFPPPFLSSSSPPLPLPRSAGRAMPE